MISHFTTVGCSRQEAGGGDCRHVALQLRRKVQDGCCFPMHDSRIRYIANMDRCLSLRLQSLCLPLTSPVPCRMNGGYSRRIIVRQIHVSEPVCLTGGHCSASCCKKKKWRLESGLCLGVSRILVNQRNMGGKNKAALVWCCVTGAKLSLPLHPSQLDMSDLIKHLLLCARHWH